MPFFEVTIYAEDADREIYHDQVLAVDEDAAIDQAIRFLDGQGISYGLCMAEEV